MGFYRTQAPAQHFRTSAHASPLLAGALARLARECGLSRVVDVGSGRGELLAALGAADPGLTLVGVDVVDRPAALSSIINPGAVDWVISPGGADLPEVDLGRALVVAHEWLDDVPCTVVEVDEHGELRVVEVSMDGVERLAGTPTSDEMAWVRRWWPITGPGTRIEVGLDRDRAWDGLRQRACGSVLVAVDYDHRRDARPPAGTLSGYRAGRAVPPVPDGSCDLTAHVALDSLSGGGVLTTQRDALLALGVETARPPIGLASTDPAAYLDAVVRAGEVAELVDRGGLGGFGWLVQSTGPLLPAALRRLDRRGPGSPG